MVFKKVLTQTAQNLHAILITYIYWSQDFEQVIKPEP